MEGMGSRLGRTSARYGLSATATIFNGPVRKWKRKWVHVSPSPTLNYRSNNHSNGHNDQNHNRVSPPPLSVDPTLPRGRHQHNH
ncbi:hypothetical protein OIU84_002731 [Salix udensis]|uniref:Uncharacterized protein n=1 Tax=Salix udensis TaxID=889485 RepID=A0AAD6K6Y3_9ROSI|nr:hypothetical protein OIU84_002731 [Salix udensis]